MEYINWLSDKIYTVTYNYVYNYMLFKKTHGKRSAHSAYIASYTYNNHIHVLKALTLHVSTNNLLLEHIKLSQELFTYIWSG